MRNTGLSTETHAVIDAVLDALDIPYAATVGHEVTREAILRERLMQTMVWLQSLRRTGPIGGLDGELEFLRERLAEHPAIGYVTHDQAHERIQAGATWMEAVRLDYDGPGSDGQDDEAGLRERAARRATWPGGEPESIRGAAEDVAAPNTGPALGSQQDPNGAAEAEDLASPTEGPANEDGDEEPCMPWCDGTHKPLFHCAGEDEEPRCFREIGRTPGGEGQLIVGLGEEIGWTHLELIHTADTASDIEELKCGDISLLTDQAAALIDLLRKAYPAFLAARKWDLSD